MGKTNIQLVTKRFRVSYPNVFKPRTNEMSGKDEYNVQALWPKGTDLTELLTAIESVKVAKWGPDETKWPKFKYEPLKPHGKTDEKTGKVTYPDGHEEGGMSANLKCNADVSKPVVTKNKGKDLITDPADFYAGCWAVAQISVSAYDAPGNKGVSLYLNSICKVGDGEPLSGRMKPEDAFSAIEETTDF